VFFHIARFNYCEFVSHQLSIVLTLYLSYYKAKSLGGGRIPWRASDLF
jgi:hypothetical protein